MKGFAKHIGFKEGPDQVILKSLIYDLGRNRHLALSNVGTPNEMLCICGTSRVDHRRVEDVVTLHNWDYDGYLKPDALLAFVSALDISYAEKKKTKNQ